MAARRFTAEEFEEAAQYCGVPEDARQMLLAAARLARFRDRVVGMLPEIDLMLPPTGPRYGEDADKLLRDLAALIREEQR